MPQNKHSATSTGTNIEELTEKREFFFSSKLFFLFPQIPSGPDPDCISFGAKQINPMGLVQPANAILYDFYNPGKGTEK